MKSSIIILAVLLAGQGCLAKPVVDDESASANPSIFIQKMLNAFSSMMHFEDVSDISDISETSGEEFIVVSSDNSTTSSEEEFISDAMEIIQEIFGNPFVGSKKVVIFQQIPSNGGEISIGRNGEASFVNKNGDDSVKAPENGEGIVVKFSEFHGKTQAEWDDSDSDDESIESSSDDSFEGDVDEEDEEIVDEETEDEEEKPVVEEKPEVKENPEFAEKKVVAYEKSSKDKKKIDTKDHSFEFDVTEEDDDVSIESEEGDLEEHEARPQKSTDEKNNEIAKDSLEEKEGLHKSIDTHQPIKISQADSKDFEWVKNARSEMDLKPIGDLIEKRIDETFGEDDSEESEIEDNYKYLSDFLRYIGF